MSNNKKIEVLIVEDHAIVRQGLRMFLEEDSLITVKHDVANIQAATEYVATNSIDVVVLDYKLPDGDGITACLNFKTIRPNIKVIILTAFGDSEIINSSRRAGADAFLLKDVEGEKLVDVIIGLMDGIYYLADCSSTSETIKTNCNEFNLTDKEVHILNMIVLGKVNKEIAQSLNLNEKTVRNYISIIFKKINVSNRTEAASFWHRHN